MCNNHNENRTRDIKAEIAEVTLSDYRLYFPDLGFEPLEQIQYIQSMVKKLRNEKSTEVEYLRSIEKDIQENKDDESDILKLAVNHHGLIYMRNDALRANIQIAMLAPAIEGLYRKTLYNLMEERSDQKTIKKIFNNKKRFERGVVERIMNALEELNISSDIKDILTSLFGYRNALFHNGLEWRKEDCEEFLNDCKEFLNKEQMKDWFILYSNAYGPYFVLPTNEFIDKLIDFFHDSMDSFVKSKQSFKEHLSQ